MNVGVQTSLGEPCMVTLAPSVRQFPHVSIRLIQVQFMHSVCFRPQELQEQQRHSGGTWRYSTVYHGTERVHSCSALTEPEKDSPASERLRSECSSGSGAFSQSIAYTIVPAETEQGKAHKVHQRAAAAEQSYNPALTPDFRYFALLEI